MPSGLHFADVFSARPLGAQVWLDVTGNSLEPFMRRGDSLLLQRCEEASLVPGDIAVARHADGVLVSRVVVGARPEQGSVKTSPFLGPMDVPALSLLGRAVGLRWGDSVWPVTPWSRRFVRALQWTTAKVRGLPGATALGQKVLRRRWPSSPSSSAELRVVRPEDP